MIPSRGVTIGWLVEMAEASGSVVLSCALALVLLWLWGAFANIVWHLLKESLWPR